MVHSGSAASNAPSRPSGPKLERPRVESGISLEEWNVFQHCWNVYKPGSGIDDIQASTQLFQCANNTLGDAMLKVDPDIMTRSIGVVIATMKTLAVIPVVVGVLRAELLELRQKRDEPFQSFATRVRGKAETCGFVAQYLCNCGLTNSVDYTENIIEGLIDKPTNEIIALVEKKEMACDANVGSASTSAISSMREGHLSSTSKNSISLPPGLPESCSANRSKQIPCPQCSFGFSLKPHKLCIDCYKSHRQSHQVKGQNGSAATTVSSMSYQSESSPDVISQISVISSSSDPEMLHPQSSESKPSSSSNAGHVTHTKLGHHISISGEWKCAKFLDRPTMGLSLSVNKDAYKGFSKKPKSNHIPIRAKLDTCTQSLPTLEGPAIKIHIDESATPKACHTPSSIPFHCQEKVHLDLLCDEALGIIEKVPYGEPVTWCHRMYVTRKHYCSSRRTVDLYPLNKHCKRETVATESPFQIVRCIPRDTWKTVTDAWNGYHGVPLEESDRHLATFITPYGRWRYLQAPQGFVSSGDGYNR